MNRISELFRDREKLPEALNITHPEVIRKIHKAYIDAGSDVIYTATFGVNDYKTKDSEFTAESMQVPT